jgi:hypothetical protein
MRTAIFVALILATTLMAGCTAKEEAPPATLPPTEAPLEDIPQVGEVSQEELPTEPDFELNETVDLGSLL